MSDVRDSEALIERLVRLGDALDLHEPMSDDITGRHDRPT